MRAILKIPFVKWKLQLNKQKHLFSFNLLRIPTTKSKGFASRCEDTQHILLLDYDNVEKFLVEDEIFYLQERYKLPQFYLFTTHQEKSKVSGELTGNYHAVCLKKMSFGTARKIQDETHCDNNYKSMTSRTRYKSWVLRAGTKGERGKPRYLGIVGRPINNDCTISTAHLNFLSSMYDIDIIDYKNQDKLTKLYGTTYMTHSKTKIREVKNNA